MDKPLRIGTRGSRLAIVQTELVAHALTALDPSLTTQQVIITTTGDTNQTPIPLDTVGKSWFTREIDDALHKKHIDLAVHSLKDLPLAESPGLSLQIVLPRADPRDCVISASGKSLAKLPSGAVVGTDSARRRALILQARPDLAVKSIRGNVQTRLKKLRDGLYDAIVLAAAGLIRLNEDSAITEYLDPESFIPASGQASLAAVARTEDTDLISRLIQLTDEKSAVAVLAERTFSARFGGGCQLPVAAFAQIDGGSIRIHGVIAELNGPGILTQNASGPTAHWLAVAQSLADDMRKNCPFELEYA